MCFIKERERPKISFAFVVLRFTYKISVIYRINQLYEKVTQSLIQRKEYIDKGNINKQCILVKQV